MSKQRLLKIIITFDEAAGCIIMTSLDAMQFDAVYTGCNTIA